MTSEKKGQFLAAIFDLDGTLVDSYPGIHESLNFALTTLSMPAMSLGEVKKIVGKGLDNLILQTVGQARLEEGKELFRKYYETAQKTGTFLLPEVNETLETLQRWNVRMSLASNKPSEFTKTILQNLQLSRFFRAAIGPEDVRTTKPDPAMLNKLMKSMAVENTNTLYVGDMLLDVQTAKNAGVSVAVVATGGNTLAELQESSADFVFDRISEILPLFREIGKA
jgi:2-phosphoglycolate phosphatase